MWLKLSQLDDSIHSCYLEHFDSINLDTSIKNAKNDVANTELENVGLIFEYAKHHKSKELLAMFENVYL